LVNDILCVDLFACNLDGFEELFQWRGPWKQLAAKPVDQSRDDPLGPHIAIVTLGRKTGAIRNTLTLGGRFGVLGFDHDEAL